MINKTGRISYSLKFIHILWMIILFSSAITAQATYEEKEVLVTDYFKKGQQVYKKKDYTTSLYWFQRALLIDPEGIACLIMAGNSCANRDLYASAIYYYTKSLEIYPRSAAYNNLGIIYGKLGYDSIAIESAEKVNKDNVNRYTSVGAILYRHGKYKESMEKMREAIKIKESQVAYYNIGVVYQQTEKPDSACYYFDKAIELDPEYSPAYYAKALIMQKTGSQEKESKDLLKRVIALTSENIGQDNNTRMRGTCYKLIGNKEKAEKDLNGHLGKIDELILLYPDAYPFMLDRGYTYESLDRKEDAIADYRKVLEINPQFEEARKALHKLLNK